MDWLQWLDPYFQKENALHEAEVVNLGFVLNVIEDRDERNQALINAFKLTKKVLVVGVMLLANRHLGQPYKDGFLTSKRTFQKYYMQDEFKAYIESTLNEKVILTSPGIALVFKDKQLESYYE